MLAPASIRQESALPGRKSHDSDAPLQGGLPARAGATAARLRGGLAGCRPRKKQRRVAGKSGYCVFFVLPGRNPRALAGISAGVTTTLRIERIRSLRLWPLLPPDTLRSAFNPAIFRMASHAAQPVAARAPRRSQVRTRLQPGPSCNFVQLSQRCSHWSALSRFQPLLRPSSGNTFPAFQGPDMQACWSGTSTGTASTSWW